MRTAFIWALTALTAVSARVSNTGRCGAANGGLVCTGSSYGNCCSQYGWCGRTSAYCGTGCNSGFGTCSNVASSSARVSTLRTSTRSSSTVSSSTRSSSAAAASSTLKVSTSARCGYAFGATGGFTCAGSKFGDCCSQYSYWYAACVKLYQQS
ncbi:carbohydrate-binding module family 18 protein [Cucurbitaria berberidis CBS 394.84]|uniref:Carbohydrate-binding module family 18 protein n=1 Tax=Cucurbitaria berberidis CBS 394.84 TaxID=1168544 RepID=A0A9P4GPF9_9PLEO|nr:carbohydrate-binding module family 18 protein [Cucurbitaria berberidis CBS 394.84]KAF1850248.1 carbohydrate-binding module family 18 protein [Cucurbitaria berberidis CBS 394.84]